MCVDDGHLDSALNRFERVDANLFKLEAVWRELQSSIAPDEHEELGRFWCGIIGALPAIDGYRIRAVPMSRTEAELLRFEAREVGEASALADAEEEIAAPGAEIREYRFKFNRYRRNLVRDRIIQVVSEIDELVEFMRRSRLSGTRPAEVDWDALGQLVAELDRLTAGIVPRVARWSDLRRHLHFAQEVDLKDIVNDDWPSVKGEVEAHLYDDREPLPVDVDDLGDLARTRPTGPVTTRLKWEAADDEEFERLVFELIRTTDGYENANWLMKTRAADRGRDLQADRIIADPLGPTRRLRVIVQCRHWRSRSISVTDLSGCVASMSLWEPPPIDVLIVATSGRFTQDAVKWIEARDEKREVPRIDPWPDSHLESLLSRRPDLVAKFRLR